MADGTAITTTHSVIVGGGEALSPLPAGSPAHSRFQEVMTKGQLIRFEADDATGGNTGAVEVRVVAPAG